MASLYEINKQIEEILETLVDEETGEVDEEKLDALNQLNIDRKAKIENCILYAKSLKADAEAILKESDALKDRATVKLNRAERTLQYVEYILSGEEFETDRCQVTYRPSKTVEIINIDAIPEQYMKVKTTTTPDKMAIKKVLKDGGLVPGAVLEDHLKMRVK